MSKDRQQIQPCSMPMPAAQPQLAHASVQQRDPVPPIVHEVLNEPSQTLAASNRNSIAPHLAMEFSHIPVHSPRQPMPNRLELGQPGDHFEHEAQHVATRVRHKPEASQPSVGTQASHAEKHLGNVQIHTGSRAAAAAQSIDARAYTLGNHIVFGTNSYAPDTEPGRKLIAHEMTHVAQQAQSNPASQKIQRVGFFESIARFFGGGTFSEQELRAYIEGLRGTNAIEDNIDSDNKARAAVQRGMHRNETIQIRVLLIREMLSGSVGGEDQQGILTVLQDATPDDRERIVEQVGANALREKFGGDERDRLYLLLGGVARHRGDPVPSEWQVGFSVQGAEELQRNRLGLVIDQLQAQPQGAADSIQIAQGAINTNLSGVPARVSQGAIQHPRDAGGRAFMAFHLAPVGQDGGISTASTAEVTRRNADYPPITRDRHRVLGNVSMRIGRQRTGDVAQMRGSETESGTQTETGRRSTTGVQESTGNRQATTNSQSQSAERGNVRERQQMRGSENSQTTTVERTLTISTENSHQLEGRVTVGGEFAADGRLLGLLLALAGPEGIALYGLLYEAGILESTQFKVNGSLQAGYTVQTKIRRDVAERWASSRTQIQRQGQTDINRSEQRQRQERGSSQVDETSSGRSSTATNETSSANRQSQAERNRTSVTETDFQFEPVVEQADLEFRVQ